MNQKGYEDHRVIFSGGGLNSKQTTLSTTAANSTAWLDMQGWGRCLIVGIRIKGTATVGPNTGVYASAASTGTNAAAVTTLGATGTATGLCTALVGTILKPNTGCIVFSVSADQVAGAVTNGRYISVKIKKNTTKTDRWCWTYILCDPKLGKAANMLTGANSRGSAITAP